MARYLAGRLLQLVIVVLLILALTFVIYFVIPPVSPAVLFAGKHPTPQLIAQVKENLGLNHPIWVQYLLFVRHFLFGDQWGWPGLGSSYVTHSSVRSLIGGRLVITAVLAGGAALVWVCIGIPMGVLSALRRGRLFDRLSLGLSLFFVSAPVFWLGVMSLWLFWYKLGVAPGSGYYPPGQYGFGAWVGHMILPWIVLALLYAGWYARMSRASVLDVLRDDFIRTARAKGISEWRVVVHHVLRASLTPLATMFGMDLAGLLGGTVIVEIVFNLQGMGQFAVESVFSGDLPSVLGVTLIVAIGVTIANVVVDMLYATLDPRVRLGR
ncbi:MAG TPA: ABC transporter permease [Streptosporangiaceae bacterium]|nr:ABC transporter permease [Streptosporangiaceae bacterium]